MVNPVTGPVSHHSVLIQQASCLNVASLFQQVLYSDRCFLCYSYRVHSVDGIRLFTTSGYKYFRQFHISLCSGGGDIDSEYPPASCINNATSDIQVS